MNRLLSYVSPFFIFNLLLSYLSFSASAFIIFYLLLSVCLLDYNIADSSIISSNIYVLIAGFLVKFNFQTTN
jgi:hypothetical protein